MPEPDDTPPPADGALPTNLGGVNPGEMLARGMQSAKMSGRGAHGWEPPTPAEVAHLFPTYEILHMLGRGGMGAVYKARQIALDRLVAIKLLPLEISVDKDFADRFRREARAMAKLNHPHIIAVHDFGQTGEGHLFFAMEFVEGANLHDIIHHSALTPDQALAIAAQVCTALAYAHGKGVVHRDIKPANVMLDTESQVKVADFGLARLLDAGTEDLGHTVTGTVMGTPDYMAPEQTRGMNVDHRADIYSLGVMLYEMLCRETPRGAFDLPSARTGCDPRLDAIVLKAMQQAPDRRYQSTQDMKADVDSVRGHTVATSAGTQEIHPYPVAQLALPEPRVAMIEANASHAEKKSRFPLSIGAVLAVVAAACVVFLLPKLSHNESARNSDAGIPRQNAMQWHDLVAEQRASGKLTAWAEDKGDYVLSKSDGFDVYSEPDFRARNVTVRATWAPNKNSLFIQLRVLRDAAGQRKARYDCRIDGDGLSIFFVDYPGDKYHERGLAHWPLPHDFDITQRHTLIFRSVDDRLQVQLDDVEVGVLKDRTLDEAGGVGIKAPIDGRLYKVEYLSSDPSSSLAGVTGQSAIAAATKDAPFVNTLGMKFVPVPITGGASGGQRVLFSVWDTRVQDYEVYARGTNVNDEWISKEKDGVPVSRGADYPVVGVSWDDAKAFCQWLTEKERAGGRLPQGMKYRLPTDQEWSRAVGLVKEEGATPKEREGKDEVDYPWGLGFPPPKAKVGNYADAAWHEKFPNEKYWIDDYTDGYATTSPVGSFPPNAYGLYDMGGNVWQWCEDWYEAGGTDRVLRGAAWNNDNRRTLLSSSRHFRAPGAIYDFGDIGFRCVLAPASTAPPAAK